MNYDIAVHTGVGAQGGTMEYGSLRAEEFGDLQRLVDGLFYDRHAIDRLDLIVQAEIMDLTPDLMEIVNLLPPEIGRAHV